MTTLTVAIAGLWVNLTGHQTAVPAAFSPVLTRPRTARISFIWRCQTCDLTSDPCATQDEAAFLGQVHARMHHGTHLGISIHRPGTHTHAESQQR